MQRSCSPPDDSEPDSPGQPVAGAAPVVATVGTTNRNRLLAIIALLLGIAALRISYPVTMPLAFAIVIIAAIWPVKPWFDHILPSWLSYAATILVLLAVLVGFAASIYFSAAQIVRAFLLNWESIERIYRIAGGWANEWGVPLEGQFESAQILALVQQFVSQAYTLLVYLGFIGVLVILGLPEVPQFRKKLRLELHGDSRREFIETVETIAEKVRRYLGVTTATSLLTGIASALWAYAVGLELALTWGVINFLLNYVPVIGNLIGIIPPTLYAIIQFDSYTVAIVVFLGYAAIQTLISNFVYPLLQGQSLSLSPVTIVLALAFWGWLWGIAGALIAIPLTSALVIICEHFPSTEWIAKLLCKRSVTSA